MWGVSLTRTGLFYVGSFSYTPLAVLCGEFLFHTLWCFVWGVSLTYHILFYVGSFSYTPQAVLCGEFLLHAPCWFMWGVSLRRSMLFYVRSFSYRHIAVLCGEFLLHAPWCFMWGVSLTRPVLFYVRSFSYMPPAVLCGEFLLHTPGSFLYGDFLASSSLLWPESWQTNARTRCVGWSLCTVPQIKQVSVVIKMTWQMNRTGRANPSLIERNIPGVHGVAIGIRLWQMQLVWIRLGTNRQRLRANTTSQSLDFVSHQLSSFLSFSVLHSVLVVSL